MSLGDILRDTKRDHNASLQELTVLSPQNDPFRLDTPANHIKGKWFRDQMERAGLFRTAAPIHNRGIHYAIVSLGDALLPNGSPYFNNLDCWGFLEEASNTARWLGYMPWEKIIDARNAEPVIHIANQKNPFFWIQSKTYALPEADDYFPRVMMSDYDCRQKYHLVIYGEKTSLGGVLEPIAAQYGADLYLPSGEISNSQLAMMARVGAADGRPMVVFAFTDCDPAGYQMAASIGHKLRALRDGFHPELEFELHAPALTVEQVRSLRLPSTPLKDSERRADGWRARYGIEQTEIDALATLRPEVLRDIAETAIDPFFDYSLAARLREAKAAWRQQATERLVASLGEERMAERQAGIAAIIDQLREQSNLMDDEIENIDLAMPPLPSVAVTLDAVPPPALVSSDLPLIEHIRTLRDRKDYSGGAA
ncbi:MAG: hypothetical protein WBH00_11685 [Xanthobacteraceae bacterium]